MNTAICTLFEGDYHLGVVSLANSLHHAGFSGDLFCGFRGKAPAWSSQQEARAGNVRIRLIALDETLHFTNFKPQFMRRVFTELAPTADAVLYCDPDLCITAPWNFLETWIEAGIALSEDVNSPLSENHPRRMGWRKFYASHGVTLSFHGSAYVNGGAVGVTRSRLNFLETWEQLQALMGEIVGGLNHVKLDGGTSSQMRNPFFCFNSSDQDALNATLEALPSIPTSILGREAMGFASGLCVLPHALGSQKPWRKKYLRKALYGRAPSAADHAYWRFAQGPLKAWPARLVRRRHLQLRMAQLFARLWPAVTP